MAFTLIAGFLPSALWGAPIPTKAAEKQYVLLPVTTDLQRQELLSPKDRFYLVVYGSGVVDKDGHIIPQLLDFQAVEKDFVEAGTTRSPGDKLQFVVLYERSEQKIGRTLALAVKGFVAELGFPADTDVSSIHPGAWDRLMRITNKKRGLITSVDKEDPVGDGAIRAYQVRTPLSRYLTDADCFVSVTEPVARDFDGKLPKEWNDEIVRSVRKLELPAKESITFEIRYEESDHGEGQRFYDSGAKELAKSLGFTSWNVRSGRAK